MATSAPSSTSERYKCSVCLELFTDPKVLPCCHTFCLECLKKTATSEKTKGQVTCPQCSQPHQIPAGGLPEFLTDFIAIDEVEAVRLQSGDRTGATTCGECEQLGPVTCFCTECHYFLCAECEQLHKKVKAYRSHIVVPREEVHPAALQRCRVHYCSVHNAEVLKLYCETCEKLVCRDCTLVEHRQHNYTFVQDARKQIESEMKSLQTHAQANLTPLNKNLREIRKIETAVIGHPHVLKADINLFFDNLVTSIEARRSALLKEAGEVCQKDLKQVMADREFHDTTIAHTHAVLALTDKALRCADDSEMIATALQVISQLRILKEREWDSHSFVHTVLATPTFSKGDNDVNKFGNVACDDEQKFFHLELVNNQNPQFGGFTLTMGSMGGATEMLNSAGVHNLGRVLKERINVKMNNPNHVSTIDVPSTQSLTDRRSGKSITLRQSKDRDLKVVVCYGGSAREVDSSSTIERQNIPSHGYYHTPRGGLLFHSDQVPTQQLVIIASYVVSLRLVCGGRHCTTFKYGGSELEHSFTVEGQPAHGSRVKKGPDWKPALSALPHPYTHGHNHDVIGTVIRSGGRPADGKLMFGTVPNRPMGICVYGTPQAVPVQEIPGMVIVDEGSGFVGRYKWGKDDEYEIELA